MTSHFCVEEPKRVQADVPRPVGANCHRRQGPRGKGEAGTARLSVPGLGQAWPSLLPPAIRRATSPPPRMRPACVGGVVCWASSLISAPRVGELPTRTWPWGWGAWPAQV